jgi:hypothetical protein
VTRIIGLAGVSAATAALLTGAFGREVWLGMLAPLVVVSASWMVAERVYRASPAHLTSVMIGAFTGKLVFFGVYVAVVVGVLGARPVPFALSFAGYFIALHMIEALWLKRLFVS